MFWPFTVWGFLKPNFEPHEYWLSRTRCCNSTYRLRYWNTLRIRSFTMVPLRCNSTYRLRYWNLPPSQIDSQMLSIRCNSTYRLRYWNHFGHPSTDPKLNVATVLTVYGIETSWHYRIFAILFQKLQQYLPFTVLKLSKLLGIIVITLCCNSTYRLRYWNQRWLLLV